MDGRNGRPSKRAVEARELHDAGDNHG